ncbi:MAG: MFS transporter [Thermoleophilia bacterium]|nr:MFS transporter [Thermoleophilia bacterium]
MRRLFFAVSATMFVDSLLYLAIVPLLPWYADEFDLSKVGAGLLLASYPVAFLLVTTPAGWLAGRYGPRRVVMVGTTFFLAATALFALAQTGELIILARLLQGVGGGIGWAAAMAWLTGNVVPERRSRAIGAISGVLSAGAVAGPVLGAVAGATSPELAFGIAGAIALVALIATILTPIGATLPKDPALHHTLGQLLGHPLVICALALALADAGAVAAVDLLGTLALGAAGVGTTTIGVAIATGAALGIGAGIVAGRIGERVGSFRVALIGGIGLGVMPWLLALPLQPWMILAVLVAIGPFFPILMTGIFPLMTSAADDLGLSHGTANALANMVWSAGFAIVPLVIAPIAEALGDPVAYVLSGTLVVALLLLATIMRARSRSMSMSY